MNNDVLLVGNGINNVDIDNSWGKLLKNLCSDLKIKDLNFSNKKPFPLLYEEIYFKANNSLNLLKEQKNEFNIKEIIAKQIRVLQPNEVHKLLLNLPIEHILTTNYDLTLENIFFNNTKKIKNNGVIRERVYSIFRHYNDENKNIWHIHGDVNYPQSINLGYTQYGSYLQKISEYIHTKPVYEKFDLAPLANRLKKIENKIEIYSWLDLFFTKNVHIVGLSLDFVEIHLWWLITTRKRFIIQNKAYVKNKIYYYYPDSLHSIIIDKISLLKSADVEVVKVAEKIDTKEYYRKVIDEISNKIK